MDGIPGNPDLNMEAADPDAGPSKQTIPEEVRKDMRKLWEVLRDSTPDAVNVSGTDGTMQLKELRVLLRALTFELNEDEMEYYEDMCDPDETNIFRFSDFHKVMEHRLKELHTKEDCIACLKKITHD